MKRKIFSTLLMGAFVFASLSTVTSCKDYDDDINGLQTELASLKSNISSLESSVSTAQSTATAAQSTANDALSQAKDALAKANAAATQTDLDALKKRVETAEGKISSLETEIAKLDDIQSQINDLKTKVANCATKEELAALQTEFDKLKAQFDALYQMVTGVELFGTFSGSSFAFLNEFTSTSTISGKTDAAGGHTYSWSSGSGSETVGNHQHNLSNGTANVTTKTDDDVKPVYLEMMHGNVAYTADFGDNEALKTNLTDIYATATPVQKYTKGTDIKTSTGLLLRVNPANADLTKSKLLIVNSKGEALDDYVTVLADQATRYNELITRGTTINTGLWSVPVEFKEGVDMAKFANALKTTVNGQEKTILFAVAVNNTDAEAAADRWATSTFDLTLGDKAYTPSTALDFTVDGNEIAEIHNRWTGSQAQTGTVEPQNVSKAGLHEYKWKASTTAQPTPAAAIVVKNGIAQNAQADTDDARYDEKLLKAYVGTPITVELKDKNVEYYYVTLDENFAIESEPSELNAWKTYTIDGLNKVTSASDKLQITVKDLANVKGDVIGFRLYAVNYDGTLVDPDGKAFYALVGDEVAKASVDVEIVADKTTPSAIVALPSTFVKGSNTISGEFAQSVFDNDGKTTTTGAKIAWKLLGEKKSDGTYKDASNWSEAKFVEVTLKNANNFQDGQSWTVVAEDDTNDGTLTSIVNSLTINVKKVMPTEPKAKITWKTNQATADGVYTCYVEPSQLSGTAAAIEATWSTASDNGYKNLYNAVNGIDDANYTFDIANASYNEKTEAYDKTLEVTSTNGTDYKLQVAKALIDNKTEHAITVNYDYKDVSLTWDSKKSAWSTDHTYSVASLNGKIIFACPLADPVQTYAWKVNEVKDKDGKVTSTYTNNYVIYEQTNKFGDGDVSAAELIEELVATNTWDPDFSGSVWASKPLYVAFKSAKLVTAKGDNAGKEEYYDITTTTATPFSWSWSLKSGATNPQLGDVECNLEIVLTDCYGHDNTFTVPFTVKQKK